ncbi:MAG TPA: head GIN domain-containing protein [Ferruginibacter sp.]|nr:head GIN domain-containing protein [Ferruginibacter sp.]
MKKLFLSIACLISFAVFAQETKVINDANAITRNLNSSFTAINVSSGIDLYLTQGNEESLAVSAYDPKYIDRLITEVVDGTLKIYFNNKGLTWKSGVRHLRAYVSCKTLEKLVATAGSDVFVSGNINASNLNVDVNSGAGFSGAVQATEMTVKVSSGASIKITGSAGKLIVSASSGADFKGYDFVTEYCNATASSGAGVRLTINKELIAKATSGADIHYKGTGLIRDIKTSGGGSVKRL